MSASSSRGSKKQTGQGGRKAGTGGSSTPTRKTTARSGGKAKSAQARARSHVKRSAAAGAGENTAGQSRTLNRPAPDSRTGKPGPGDVRPERVRRER